MTDSTSIERAPRYGLLVVVAAGASFLAFLDATVANLAVPSLAKDFPSSSIASLSWLLTIYAVVFAALLAPTGRLADVIGRRKLYFVGMGLFTLSSLLCAVAPDVAILLIFRGFQAAGAAAMIPASLAIVLADSPPERRMGSIAKWAAAASAAAAIGPSLGGVLIDAFGWRAVFLINVPLGIILLLVARIVPRTGAGRGRVPDLVGTVLLAIAVGVISLGVTQGHTWGWTDAKTLASLVGGAIILTGVLLRSNRHPTPAIETKLWKIRTFALANVVSLMLGAALYAWLLGGVLYLTEIWRYSELKAGLAMSPGAVASAIVVLFAPRVMAKYGPRAMVIGGAVMLAGTGLWLTFDLPAQPHFLALWLPAGLLSGVGLGSMSTGVSTAAAMAVEPIRFAGATGLNLAARQFGGALGLATMAVLLESATGKGTGGFTHVYLFCASASILAGVFGIGLVKARRPVTPKSSPTTPARQPAAPAANATSA